MTRSKPYARVAVDRAMIRILDPIRLSYLTHRVIHFSQVFISHVPFYQKLPFAYALSTAVSGVIE